jgi:hypothetical protein
VRVRTGPGVAKIFIGAGTLGLSIAMPVPGLDPGIVAAPMSFLRAFGHKDVHGLVKPGRDAEGMVPHNRNTRPRTATHDPNTFHLPEL